MRDIDDPVLLAARNVLYWVETPYLGRGIVLGIDETGQYAVLVYFIEGRSKNSRNRVLTFDKGRLFTEPANPAEVKDPSLIIYNAMRQNDFMHAVSNGAQTDQVVAINGNLMDALTGYKYEPDAPNFTPRITGAFYSLADKQYFALSILRKSLWNDGCDASYYTYDSIQPSYGFGITTYAWDGNPLPSFEGDPILLPLVGDIDEIADNYWQVLSEENRVALAVKFIPMVEGVYSVALRNRYVKV